LFLEIAEEKPSTPATTAVPKSQPSFE
jgi:hypothetical protein